MVRVKGEKAVNGQVRFEILNINSLGREGLTGVTFEWRPEGSSCQFGGLKNAISVPI